MLLFNALERSAVYQTARAGGKLDNKSARDAWLVTALRRCS
ncbi:MAG: hypothetical protein R3F65_23895 [bacterium]